MRKDRNRVSPGGGTPWCSLRGDWPDALPGALMLGTPVNEFGSHEVYIKDTCLKIETRGIVLLPHWFSKQEGFVLNNYLTKKVYLHA